MPLWAVRLLGIKMWIKKNVDKKKFLSLKNLHFSKKAINEEGVEFCDNRNDCPSPLDGPFNILMFCER